MRESRKRIPAAVLLSLLAGAACCLWGLSGCAKKGGEQESTEKQVVVIPMILTVNPETGIRNEGDVVDAFNEEYEGIYRVEVDWTMETEEEYRQNLKRQNATDSLPAVLTDLRMLPSFNRKMIADGRLMNLADAVNSDEEWKSMIEPVALESVTEEDGSIYMGPVSTAAFTCSGIFWNEELFLQAGITEFPETWEEFWQCCDRLQAAGITPLALHTEGTAWAPMLIATAKAAETGEGLGFLKELYPDSYQNETGLVIAETLKRLFDYTTEDAVHADFDVAYTNFFSGQAAMLPNGYWQIEQMPEGWENRVRFSPFPGNTLIASPETYGWAVVDSYPEEVKKGAVAFLKFRTTFNYREKEELFGTYEEAESQVLADYLDAYRNMPQIVPNYQVKWNSILQEETLGEYLPLLIGGEITPEEFTAAEDQSIEQFQAEQ